MAKYIPPQLRPSYKSKLENIDKDNNKIIKSKIVKFPTDLDTANDTTKDYEVPVKIHEPHPIYESTSPKSVLKRKISDITDEELSLPSPPTFIIDNLPEKFKTILQSKGIKTVLDEESKQTIHTIG